MVRAGNYSAWAGFLLAFCLALNPAGGQKITDGQRPAKELPGPTLTVRPIPVSKPAAAAPRPVGGALHRIVIPSLQAENKPARQVFEMIVAMARHEDPDNVGVNLLYQCSAAALKRRVTLDVTNLKLGDVLQYVCQACGLEYVVEDFAVIIVDRRK